MSPILQKLPFIFELFFNGTFIVLYSLKNLGKLPAGWNPQTIGTILDYGVHVIPFSLLAVVMSNYFSSKNFEDFLRKHIFSVLVFIPLVIAWGDLEFSFLLASAHLLSSVLSLYDDTANDYQPEKGPQLLRGIPLKPAQLVLFSFAGVIFLGTFLLMLPFSSVSGNSIPFVDAFFLSTSATCVTGLATMSVGSELTVFGQVVILILIQIGGLSIMTLYASMTILLGKTMGMKDRVIMQDLLDVSNMDELFEMIVSIIKYTFIIELWGGIVLTIAFTFDGFEFSKAVYFGFFHSISAFCNAGFALFETSLESYDTNLLVNGTICALITLGGLGFIVLKELKEVIMERRPLVRLGLHSKVVLISSLLLTFSGALFIFFGEYLNALDGYSFWDKVIVSMFQSITLRTAGFNTIPLTNLHTYSIYAMTIFMFIGASPGSTGGGIKTTSLAILIQSVKSTLKGRKVVTIFDRSISGPIVVRTTAIAMISALFVGFFVLVMMRVEPEQSFLAIFFEVVSASGTVGLSLGITPALTFAGKIAISILMYIGRIGPLTMVLAIGQESATGKIEYPEGRIMIG